MGDIPERIFELPGVKRTLAPVDGLIGLVVIALQELFHQRAIGDGLAVAERHGRDLRVEQRARDDASFLDHDFDVLAGGVENLDDGFVRHQRVERREIDAAERIHDHFQAVGRHLDQAKLRPVGGLPHEFGVDRDEGLAGKMLAGFLEVFG